MVKELFTVLALTGSAMASDVKLSAGFEQPLSPERIEHRGSRTRVTAEKTLALEFEAGWGEWPGITLLPPEGKWDISQHSHIGLEVRNTGNEVAEINMRVDNPGADGVNHCLSKSLRLAPGEQRRLEIPYFGNVEPMTVKLFGMRGYPAEVNGGMDFGKIDAANITGVLIFMHRAEKAQSFELGPLSCTGVQPPAGEKADPATFFPLIDQFGQYKHRQWPGKILNETDFARHREAEAQEIAARPGPENWNRWGGWANGPTLKATGFFRTEKLDGQWWLVDPDGKLFLSHGLNCVGEGAPTSLDDRQNWFEALPDRNDPAFGFCYGRSNHTTWNYYYHGRETVTFDFGSANLFRKYGSNWKEQYADTSHSRLRSWGINTIGNWSSPAIYQKRRTPYFATLGNWGKRIEGSTGYWGKFIDMFAPEFAAEFEKNLLTTHKSTLGDPWCIGYFVDNELSWGDDTSLAAAALVSPPEQPAKQVFLADLREKYGTVESLNAAWGTAFPFWEALSENRQELTDPNRAEQDLKQFYRKCAATYFGTIRRILKEHAPNQLYAGCRFAWGNDTAADIAGEYCDIVSYNLYQPDVSKFRYPGKTDKPLIIGEFHFGALDRGMFHTGLVPVDDQAARAKAYRSYLHSMLRNPALVGCHWFKYQDEATTGRPLDGENYQIGFTDVADTPYPETIEASRDIGSSMYEYRRKAAQEK